MTCGLAINEKSIPLGGEDGSIAVEDGVSRPLPLAGAVVEVESAMAALAWR